MQQADLVFFIGSKVGQLTTSNYRVPKKNIPVIHLDADPEEIGRNFIDSVPILADARLGLEAILAALAGGKPDTDWDFESFKNLYQEWYAEKTTMPIHSDQPLKPQTIMDALKLLQKEDVEVKSRDKLLFVW